MNTGVVRQVLSAGSDHAAAIWQRRIRMTTLSTIGRVGRAAMMTLILATPALTTAAYAFDPFGGDESVVTSSAQSARYNNPAEIPLAKATADAKPRTSAMAANRLGVSDASTIAGPLDPLGLHPPHDHLPPPINPPHPRPHS